MDAIQIESFLMLQRQGMHATSSSSEVAGASDIKYLPYGTIDQKNSKGPKLSAFTFTGQREETSTGLMYYNFRFYDPSIGRFISPDDRIFPDKLTGMNKYMYVNGNPVMQNDQTGHKGNAWVHSFNTFVKRGMKEVTFQVQKAAIESLSPELRMAYGFVQPGSSNKGTGLKGFGRPFMHKPLLATVGYVTAGIDFGISMVVNPINGKPLPGISNENGTTVVYNSYLAEKLGANGYSIGGYIGLRNGASAGTKRHEYGHVRQFYNGGPPSNKHEGEVGADLLQGTMAYPETHLLLYLLLAKSNPKLYDLIFNYNLFLFSKDKQSLQELITQELAYRRLTEFFKSRL